MKKIITSLVLVSILAGCQSEDKDIFSRQVEINSIPEGAPIVIDGLKMGEAPISVGVETNEDGYFSKKTTITAIPQKESYHTHVITFPAFSPTNPDLSLVPSSIIFDMTKVSSDESAVIKEN